ncbi:MAG: hypothetical protein JO276_10555 [Sphingomonadaceae bacterium]|nr:hypothetical protein [Sphingomonadaceae bacterium]
MNESMTDKKGPDREDARPARRRWSRPELARLAAADAELGTRPAVPDGSFSSPDGSRRGGAATLLGVPDFGAVHFSQDPTPLAGTHF